jgi:hypothetical protein
LQRSLASDLLGVVMSALLFSDENRDYWLRQSLERAVQLVERALLCPTAAHELLARAAVRVAWDSVDALGEPDERTGAVLDALARGLAAFAARAPDEGAVWSAP